MVGLVREYLLHSQIPTSREEQVLSILAGITGNQPTPINEQVVIYAQLKAQEVAASKTKTKPTVAQPLSYHKLVRNFGVQDDTAVNVEPWRFRAEAVPDPGVTAHISRAVIEHPATEDELSRMKPPLYQQRRHFIYSGYLFVSGNVVVKIFRFYSNEQNGSSGLSTESTPPVPSQLQLVDKSGSWVIEAFVRVGDPANGPLCEQAAKELADFRTTVSGSLDLVAPNRLALDTRVKNVG